jgi:peroxiredoxin
MKLRHAILALVVVAVAGVAAYARFFEVEMAPDVVFTSITGERIPAADLRGRVVLVNFWATDCPVCVREMPHLAQTYTRYQSRGLELIAVAMRHDPPNYVLDYVQREALPFKVALDPMGELAKAFGDVRLTPTTFLIDKRGHIVERILGELDFPRLEKLIEQKLTEVI